MRPGHDQTYTWDTTTTGGKYAFSVYGPDGFLTSFAGAVVPAGQNAGPVPTVAATPARQHRPVVSLDAGQRRAAGSRLHPHAERLRRSARRPSAWRAGHPKTVNWPADADGYYDVTVTADTGDGFPRRYAGRIA